MKLRYDITIGYRMARQRAATDEQIIAAAEELAETKGWPNVYARAVHKHMNVGGSLSTFTQVINAWRAEKAAGEEAEQPTMTEIVEDRASVIDDGLSAVAEALKTMRLTVTTEIDRAVADERKKSDRVRADERELHEKKISEMNATVDAISAENSGLAEEAQSETARADTAEDAAEELALKTARQFDEVGDKIDDLEKEAAKVPGLQSEIDDLKKAAEDLRISSSAQIAKAEDREKSAIAATAAADKKVEDLRAELSSINSDLSTARTDLATARAERAQSDEKLQAALAQVTKEQQRATAAAEDASKDKERADAAWSRVDSLVEQMKSTEKDESDGTGSKTKKG